MVIGENSSAEKNAKSNRTKNKHHKKNRNEMASGLSQEKPPYIKIGLTP